MFLSAHCVCVFVYVCVFDMGGVFVNGVFFLFICCVCIGVCVCVCFHTSDCVSVCLSLMFRLLSKRSLYLSVLCISSLPGHTLTRQPWDGAECLPCICASDFRGIALLLSCSQLVLSYCRQNTDEIPNC